MSDSINRMERYIAAGLPEASIQDLENWADDDIVSVRLRVAENPRTPLHCLIKLANDQSIDVQIAVAENLFTPDWVLKELCSKAAEDVRYSMAENACLSENIIEELSLDENPYIAHRARITLNHLNNTNKLAELKVIDNSSSKHLKQAKIS